MHWAAVTAGRGCECGCRGRRSHSRTADQRRAADTRIGDWWERSTTIEANLTRPTGSKRRVARTSAAFAAYMRHQSNPAFRLRFFTPTANPVALLLQWYEVIQRRESAQERAEERAGLAQLSSAQHSLLGRASSEPRSSAQPARGVNHSLSSRRSGYVNSSLASRTPQPYSAALKAFAISLCAAHTLFRVYQGSSMHVELQPLFSPEQPSASASSPSSFGSVTAV